MAGQTDARVRCRRVALRPDVRLNIANKETQSMGYVIRFPRASIPYFIIDTKKAKRCGGGKNEEKGRRLCLIEYVTAAAGY